MRLPAMITLFLLLFFATALPSEPLAPPEAVSRTLELVREVGEYTRSSPEAPGAFPAWAEAEVAIGEPLLVHRYPELEPSFFIVPVLDGVDTIPDAVAVVVHFVLTRVLRIFLTVLILEAEALQTLHFDELTGSRVLSGLGDLDAVTAALLAIYAGAAADSAGRTIFVFTVYIIPWIVDDEIAVIIIVVLAILARVVEILTTLLAVEPPHFILGD